MSPKSITVIDLNIGNITSVSKALGHLGVSHKVSLEARDILDSDRLIFPGVGNFFEASKRLKSLGLESALKHKVMEKKTPILGICLGMQLFATFGEEGGGSEGLDFIKGRVVYHRAAKEGLRLPHIGWNDVRFEDFKLFDSVSDGTPFYFVHSYEMITDDKDVKVAFCDYGGAFAAAVQKGHILGVQFHPEKSQGPGLALLKNYCEGVF